MSDFKRTTKAEPCKVCGKHGWCSATTDGAVAKCMVIDEGSFKQSEDGSGLAYYHRLIDDPNWRDNPRPTLPPKPPKRIDSSLSTLAATARANASERAVAGLASDLGLTTESLKRMGLGWLTAAELERRGTTCKSAGCWTFPMSNARGETVGIRLRSTDGFKYAVATPDDCHGSGIFIPAGLGKTRQLIIAEGPTDTAALLDFGFDAIGRPSNTGGTDIIRSFVTMQTLAMGWTEVVLLIDRDKPGSDAAKNTWRGARTLAEALESARRSVRICQPPYGIKDARDWLRSGANEDDVMGVIDGEAPLVRGKFDWMKTDTKGAA